ncbi:MAG TPA: M2 family metallopeptidase [Actinomycetota bacterium]|nr:M2 family metallopeptidase [Actinomycetota bacterium]
MALVERITSKLEPLDVAFHNAYWDSQVAASPETERRRADLELQLRRAKGDSEDLRSIDNALSGDLHDAMLRRQLDVLRLSFLGNQMDEELRLRLVELSTAVEGRFASFRPEVDGKRLNDNEIEHILKTSQDDDRRRQAWEASKEIGGVVADAVRELARLRNDAARALGYRDYYSMSLDLQELDEGRLFQLLDDVDAMTQGPFALYKDDLDQRLKDRFGVEDVYPWHYADPFFQALPPDAGVNLDPYLADLSPEKLAVSTFAAWDIDLSRVMEVSDLYPRDGKCQHAFCLDVDRSGRDVRILANVVAGERWTEVMLHESGHAAYNVSIDRRLPYLLRRACHIFVTEAIAILSGRLSRDPQWLQQFVGLPSQLIDEMTTDLQRSAARQSLLFARWALVVTHFERALYADPDGDLDATWWELVERFQSVTPPPDRRAPDWAAKIHVATAPVYYQNYLLGEILASQLHATCVQECGGFVGNEDAGHFLVERIFRPGNLMRWDSLIEEATGRRLSAGDFAAEVALG